MFKRMSETDMINHFTKLFHSNKGKLRVELRSEGVNFAKDIPHFVRNTSNERLYEILMGKSDLGVGRILVATDTATEIVKQSYLLMDGEVFQDVNPLDMILNGVGPQKVNLEGQKQLQERLSR